MLDKFTEEIGNGNVPLDQTMSAYGSICQTIVASDEGPRRVMFTIFLDAALAYFYEHDNGWYSVSEGFSEFCRLKHVRAGNSRSTRIFVR
jgi:hypothetical protein